MCLLIPFFFWECGKSQWNLFGSKIIKRVLRTRLKYHFSRCCPLNPNLLKNKYDFNRIINVFIARKSIGKKRLSSQLFRYHIRYLFQSSKIVNDNDWWLVSSFLFLLHCPTKFLNMCSNHADSIAQTYELPEMPVWDIFISSDDFSWFRLKLSVIPDS